MLLKKILLILILVILSETSFALTLYDDFERPNSENVSQNYNGGLNLYEYPLIINEELPYLAHNKVGILNGTLYLEGEEYCDFTTLVVDFSHVGGLRK